jgi:hypothetical protein
MLKKGAFQLRHRQIAGAWLDEALAEAGIDRNAT